MGLTRRVRRFSNVVRQTVMPGGDELGKGERFLATGVRFLVQMWRQFTGDRAPRQAAALAFETLLAIVPLTTVVLGLTRWIDAIGDRAAVQRFLERFVVPESARDLADRLAALVEAVDLHTIGWIGGAAFVLLGGLLILLVEEVLNDIWNVPRGRPLWQRVAALLGILLLALPAFAAALYLSVETLAPPLDMVAPPLLVFAALLLFYKLVPHIRVRWRSALVGAAFATLLLGAGHELFGFYIDRVRWTYESVYGAVAFFPITLFWIYLAWLFFLLGAEVSYTSQHLDALWTKARRAKEIALMGQDIVGAVSWPNAIRLALGVAIEEREGRAPVDPELVALRLSVPAETAGLLVSRLAGAGILHRDPEGRLSLARPAAGIRLVDVYDAVVDRRALGHGLPDLIEKERAAFGSGTLADRSPSE